MLPIFFLLRRRRQNLLSIRHRISNRQQFNSFDLSHDRFIELYRLNKMLARQLIEELRPYITSSTQRRGVTIEQKVLSVLRFYATGSYQRGIGQEYNTNVSQTSAHRYIHEVTLAIIDVFGHNIKFPQTIRERVAVKQQFMEHFGFPGVLGAVDCTHVAILKPTEEHNFINRKGYHSINVQIVCDATLRVININSNYGGSTHDSFIFRHSALNTYLENLEVDENFWLLGDSGYPQLSYLMTPFRNPLPDTPEANYNQHHIEARNCVERCIGLLKMRFRCLLKERSARYKPEFVGELFKACSILHNMCIDENIEVNQNDQDNIEENIPAPGPDGAQRNIAGQQPKIKQIEKLKHPNSRKTKTLAKQIQKQKSREKSKLSTNIKLNVQGEKFLWFKDNLDEECTVCTPNSLNDLIKKYLSRFDEELEQIRLKHSIGNRKNRQHANREDIIKMTVKRDFEDFNGSGIELPNLLDPHQFNLLKNWNGELRFLQNFKLKIFSKRVLEEEEKKINKNKTASSNAAMDVK